jgi:Tfp pilus assembly protein PilO
MKLNIKDFKSFLIPGIIILLILTMTILVLKPKLTVIFKSRTKLIADKKTLVNLTKKLATLEGLAKVEFTDKVNVALDVLPSDKDVPRNLSVLKKVALNNGLVATNIAISEVGEIATVSAKQKSVKGEILPFFTLNVTVVGERELIKDFISQLESTAPLMRVKRVSIIQKKTDIPETILEIQAFFLPFPKTIGKPEQQLTAITSEEEKVFGAISGLSFFNNEENLPNLPVGKENLFSP